MNYYSYVISEKPAKNIVATHIETFLPLYYGKFKNLIVYNNAVITDIAQKNGWMLLDVAIQKWRTKENVDIIKDVGNCVI